MKKAVIATIIFLLVLASPIIVNAASGKIFSPEEKPDLSQGTDADAVRCVEPQNGDREVTKDYMRINHQQKLKDERVRMVREGIKDERFQIERCFSCHTYKDFCQECHKYNGVQPGCMDKTSGCHSTEDQPASFRPAGY
ncbi:MAG: hypothetical protein ACYC0L_07350 [Thermoleophilia bacterium]